MHLIELMDRVPLWLVGLIVMIVAQTYAIGLMLLTRSTFGVSRLAENNEVAGFKFAVYAVLLAFVVVAVWEEYRNTEAAVRNDAKAAVDLHHESAAELHFRRAQSGANIVPTRVSYNDPDPIGGRRRWRSRSPASAVT